MAAGHSDKQKERSYIYCLTVLFDLESSARLEFMVEQIK